MSEYVKYATTAGDQYLASLSEMQEAFVKGMTPFTQMSTTMPKMPTASWMPELPTMAEITEANFAFANKFLKQQKKFAEKLFSITSSDVS
jgi:hypothetical protein